MYRLFAWRAGEQLGGWNDLVATEPDIESFSPIISRLETSDPYWEWQVVDGDGNRITESALGLIPAGLLFDSHDHH
jgi:hypothetical protein